jgi:exopolyphosphatase / guanosine-5'-triphosphate,3'-diphosphate pyrophosphatase
MNALRIATVDVGTNTTRLAVFDIEGRDYRIVREDTVITRLGEGVAVGRRMLPHAMDRTLAVLDTYLDTCRSMNVDRIEGVGTAVFRKAENSHEFVARVKERGLGFRVIPGEEEARLVFRGVSSGLSEEQKRNLLTMDIGGASTEFTTGHGGTFDRAVSLDLGAVTMTDRFLKNDPPAEDELRCMEAHVRETARPVTSQLRLGADWRIVGVAGTITTLAALDSGIPEWDPGVVHGHVLTSERVEALYRRLAGMTVAQREVIPAMEVKRADIISAGAGILDTLLKDCGIHSMVVSLRDIRYGILEAALEEK